MADPVVMYLMPHSKNKLYRVFYYNLKRTVSFQQAEEEKLRGKAGGGGGGGAVEGPIFVHMQPSSVKNGFCFQVVFEGYYQQLGVAFSIITDCNLHKVR